METVYLTPAIHCPPLQVASELPDTTSDAPALHLFHRVVPGQVAHPTLGLLAINRNSALAEAGFRYGGGARAIAVGLELTVREGLNLQLEDGGIMADGFRRVSWEPFGVSPSLYTWLYASAGGVVGQVTRGLEEGTEDPPALPEGSVFLRRVRANENRVVEIDGSGAFMLGEGGLLLRVTGDPGAPGDAPSPRARFLTRTRSGLYLWDGARHRALATPQVESVQVEGFTGGASLSRRPVWVAPSAGATLLRIALVPAADWEPLSGNTRSSWRLERADGTVLALRTFSRADPAPKPETPASLGELPGPAPLAGLEVVFLTVDNDIAAAVPAHLLVLEWEPAG